MTTDELLVELKRRLAQVETRLARDTKPPSDPALNTEPDRSGKAEFLRDMIRVAERCQELEQRVQTFEEESCRQQQSVP